MRVEHRAPSYQDFKDAHARRGAAIAREALAPRGPRRRGALDRIGALVEGARAARRGPRGPCCSARRTRSRSSRCNSAGFLDYYGAEHTARKVAYTLARLRPEARRCLSRVRLRPEIAESHRARRRRGVTGEGAMWGIVPAAGIGSRIQPLAFSKELLPVGEPPGTARPSARAR